MCGGRFDSDERLKLKITRSFFICPFCLFIAVRKYIKPFPENAFVDQGNALLIFPGWKSAVLNVGEVVLWAERSVRFLGMG